MATKKRKAKKPTEPTYKFPEQVYAYVDSWGDVFVTENPSDIEDDCPCAVTYTVSKKGKPKVHVTIEEIK